MGSWDTSAVVYGLNTLFQKFTDDINQRQVAIYSQQRPFLTYSDL